MTDEAPKKSLTSAERRALFEQAVPGTLVDVFVMLRRQKDELNKQKKAVNAEMDDLAFVLITKMDKLEQTSFKGVGDYTAYISELRTTGVLDHDDLRTFVRSRDDGLAFLDLRPNKEMALAYAEEHNGALPPGVKLNSVRRLNVRKTS